MTEDFPETIRPRLSSLSRRHRAVFALACCDTMAPNYHAFTLVTQRGDWRLLSTTIEETWTRVLGDDLPRPRVRELRARIGSILPDVEEKHGTWLTSWAADAVEGLDRTLEAYIGTDVSYILEVAQLSIDTIYSYLSLVNDPQTRPHIGDNAFGAFLLTCPLLLAELQRQEAALSQLESSSVLTDEIVDGIRSVARTSGIQPIQRGLVADR